MCKTCGCSDGANVRVEGEHTHVLEDGTVVRHTHGDHAHHGRAHHAHDHDGHDPHDHAHPHDGHGHAHEHERTHARGSAIESIEVRVLEKNERLAERNRGWLKARGVVALNLMSSPGAGKTTLLEKTLLRLGKGASVLEGDQETSNDADRIRKTGAKALQINTGEGCHLDAEMVWRGIEGLSPEKGSTLFIENVGNLVCPALFDLGEKARVVLFSVTEGEDKPLKYPHMFRTADLVLLTKSDLLPHLDFDMGQARASLAQVVCPGTKVIEISARTGVGMDAWLAWLGSCR